MVDIMMEFPKSWEQFVDDYKFVDKEQIYTNGSELIQVLRVKQMMQHYLPAADAIEALMKDLNDCRNELCLKCGIYKDRHLGACNGCRWYPSERKENGQTT